jgi:hypothetical protein
MLRVPFIEDDLLACGGLAVVQVDEVYVNSYLRLYCGERCEP